MAISANLNTVLGELLASSTLQSEISSLLNNSSQFTVFSANNNAWPIPANSKQLVVTCIGGGGGGGAGGCNVSGQAMSGGCGGGGGGVSQATFQTADILAVQNNVVINVGAVAQAVLEPIQPAAD